MAARSRDKIFELVELKKKPLSATIGGESTCANSKTAANGIDATVLGNLQKEQHYMKLVQGETKLVNAREQRYQELSLKMKKGYPVGATIYTSDYTSHEDGNLQDEDTVSSMCKSNESGHINKVHCSKTTFYLLVFVGIIAALTVLIIAGLSLALLNHSELRKTESELKSKLFQMEAHLLAFNHTISLMKMDIQIVKDSTKDNSEAIQSHRIRIDAVNATTNKNGGELMTQRSRIMTVNGNITNRVNMLERDILSTRATVGMVQRNATGNRDILSRLSSQNLLSNCSYAKRGVTSTIRRNTSTCTCTSVYSLPLTLTPQQIMQPTCYVNSSDTPLHTTATLETMDDVRTVRCVCTACCDDISQASFTCDLHYIRCEKFRLTIA